MVTHLPQGPAPQAHTTPRAPREACSGPWMVAHLPQGPAPQVHAEWGGTALGPSPGERASHSLALPQAGWVSGARRVWGGGSQGAVTGQMCTLDSRAPVMLGAPQTEAHTHQDSTAQGPEASRPQESTLNKPWGSPESRPLPDLCSLSRPGRDKPGAGGTCGLRFAQPATHCPLPGPRSRAGPPLGLTDKWGGRAGSASCPRSPGGHGLLAECPPRRAPVTQQPGP